MVYGLALKHDESVSTLAISAGLRPILSALWPVLRSCVRRCKISASGIAVGARAIVIGERTTHSEYAMVKPPFTAILSIAMILAEHAVAADFDARVPPRHPEPHTSYLKMVPNCAENTAAVVLRCAPRVSLRLNYVRLENEINVLDRKRVRPSVQIFHW